jgi:hypothetical protein
MLFYAAVSRLRAPLRIVQDSVALQYAATRKAPPFFKCYSHAIIDPLSRTDDIVLEAHRILRTKTDAGEFLLAENGRLDGEVAEIAKFALQRNKAFTILIPNVKDILQPHNSHSLNLMRECAVLSNFVRLVIGDNHVSPVTAVSDTTKLHLPILHTLRNDIDSQAAWCRGLIVTPMLIDSSCRN